MHCWGGVGRTGTIVASYYAYKGLAYKQALVSLRQAFSMCEKSQYRVTPETQGQLDFIKEYAIWCKSHYGRRHYMEMPLLLKDKIRGCMVGGAVGDALGYAVEFNSYSQIVKKHGAQGITRYELNHNGMAEISDDTQMSSDYPSGMLSN